MAKPLPHKRHLHLSVESDQVYAMITLSGIIDEQSVDKIEQAARDLVASSNKLHTIEVVCVDLVEVNAIAFEFMIYFHRLCKQHGIDLFFIQDIEDDDDDSFDDDDSDQQIRDLIQTHSITIDTCSMTHWVWLAR